MGAALSWIGQAFAAYLIAILVAGCWAILAAAAKRATLRWPALYAFAGRNVTAALATLRALDILACTVWLAPLYLFGLADRPSGRQMVSSYVGKAAANGHYWGIAAEDVIDALAVAFGDKPGHCLRAYLHYRGHDQ